MRQRIESLYPRHVLVDDNPNNNQGVVTPAQARVAQIHAYQELYGASLVQRPDLFAKYVMTERAGDRNRLNSFLPIGVANQLRVFAVNASIYLQLTDNLIIG
jgi:phage tail sheath gpL-like